MADNEPMAELAARSVGMKSEALLDGGVEVD